MIDTRTSVQFLLFSETEVDERTALEQPVTLRRRLAVVDVQVVAVVVLGARDVGVAERCAEAALTLQRSD